MTLGFSGRGFAPQLWWAAGVALAMSLAGLAWAGQSIILLLQVALIPLAACWLPYVKVVPWLNECRRSWRVGQLFREIIEVEDRLDRAATAPEIRKELGQLDFLDITLKTQARKLPPHWQRETILWRWHLAQLRRQALRRLRRSGPFAP